MSRLAKILHHAQQGTLFSTLYNRASRTIDEQRSLRAYKKIGKLTPLIGVKDEDYTYIVSTSDYSTGLKLFRRKPHLSHKIELLFEWCRLHLNNFDSAGKIFVNVGANIGSVLIPAIQKGYFDRAIAFEPEPLNYKLLEMNLLLNEVHSRVKTYPLALSNKNSKTTMYLSEHNLGAHAIIDKDFEQKELQGRDKENNLTFDKTQVACQTFDSFLHAHQVPVDRIGFVIVDIEGHEGHFLEGAQTLLKQKVPMVIEFCPPFLRRSGGMNMFLRNVLEHYSQMVVNPFKGDLKNATVQDSKELHTLANSNNLYDLLLIP